MSGVNKKCAKCDKQVYPVEEIKCLDKFWHKTCFKCTTCGMTLNMKNYKGFDKQPYCATHYPQQKYTLVADNPEIQRIKENTKIQSNAKYREEFEKTKGTYTSLASDLETERIKENTKFISQVKYHDEYEKSKDKYTPTAESLEINRAIENQKLVSNAEYKAVSTKPKDSNGLYQSSFQSGIAAVTYKAGEKQVGNTVPAARKIGSIADYDPLGYEHENKVESKSYKIETPLNNNNNNNDSNSSSSDLNKNKIENSLSSTSVNSNISNDGKYYTAIYDHDGNEEDEVSFREGDRFFNCQLVDVGWMVGVHEKSRKYGFFPSNYVVTNDD